MSVLPADLLAVLACPETHAPVQLASDGQLQALRDAVAEGKARRKDGSVDLIAHPSGPPLGVVPVTVTR